MNDMTFLDVVERVEMLPAPELRSIAIAAADLITEIGGPDNGAYEATRLASLLVDLGVLDDDDIATDEAWEDGQ